MAAWRLFETSINDWRKAIASGIANRFFVTQMLSIAMVKKKAMRPAHRLFSVYLEVCITGFASCLDTL
jgi:hypothetical protein